MLGADFWSIDLSIRGDWDRFRGRTTGLRSTVGTTPDRGFCGCWRRYFPAYFLWHHRFYFCADWRLAIQCCGVEGRRHRDRYLLNGGLRGWFLEQQRGEVDEVVSPDHPGVHAWGFDLSERYALRFEPRDELAVGIDEAVFGTAGHP